MFYDILNMKFDSSLHTKQYLLDLITKSNGKYNAAEKLGISYMTLKRWLIRVDDQEASDGNIPTLNQLYNYIKSKPEHIDYNWFKKHMNLSRKHYHSAMKKILDLAREYQSSL